VLALMGALLALTVWRMEAHQITFISPSIPFGGLEAHSASLLVAILLIFGLTAYGLRAVRQAENFERVMVMLLSVSLVLMAPLYMDQYQSFVMGRVVLAAMLGMGLNLVIGYAGLLDLGYVAFYAIGAYTFAFLALENDRSKVSVDFINNLGWMLVTALIVAPLVIFGASLLWSKRPSPAPRPVVKGYRRHTPVWVGQPPALVSVGMVGLVILLTFGVKEALTQAGIFAVSQFSTFLIAMVVAMVAAAFTGFMLGLPVLRLRGDYLAIVTLGFGEIISLAMNNFDTVTGGPSGAIGVPKPLPAGTGLEITNLTMLYLTMAGVALIALLSLRLRDSRLGRAWFAMSSDEDIAQAMGVNLVNVKLLAFITGASFAGLAGMLFASRQNSIFPNDFGLEVSINALALVIIGGMGSIPGVIIGSIALIGLPELLRPVADYRIMAFGLLLILTTITLPRGLVPLRPPELEAQARAIKKEDSAP
jgi:branched-chain amino acid transport system permease protein